MEMKTLLLSTAYLPDIQYFRAIYQNSEIQLELFENFPKQSFRNRTQILSDHGVMNLSIPVEKARSKQLTKDVKISYSQHWQKEHWHAIVSAYNSSPFFEYFKDDFFEFYCSPKYTFLYDFNFKILEKIMGILNLQRKIIFTQDYIFEDQMPDFMIDLRQQIHPKKPQTEGLNYYSTTNYPQVFSSLPSFSPNLSIIDMIFNIGEETINYLKK